MMKKSKEKAAVLDERCTVVTRTGKPVGRIEEARIVPSTSLIFMDAASNINVQDLTLENVSEYTLRKFNVDVTKNIFDNPKPTTRAEIRAELRRIDASKQVKVTSMQKDQAKRKFESTFNNPVGGTKKKNIGHEKILPTLLESDESLIVQEEIGENTKKLEDEIKMAKTVKATRRSKKNMKNSIVSNLKKSEKVKPKSKVDGTMKKSVGRGKIIPVSLEATEPQLVHEEVGENAASPKNETKLAKAMKAKGSSKKKVKNVECGKKRNAKKA